jgi:hypothetical protein
MMMGKCLVCDGPCNEITFNDKSLLGHLRGNLNSY